jgi:hypothetical protein
LLRDSDFTRAVNTIAEQCSVNVDVAKLKCQGNDPSTAVIGYLPAARVKMAVINWAAV